MADLQNLEARVLHLLSAPCRSDAKPAPPILSVETRARARAIATRLERLGARVALPGEPGFPGALLDLSDPPRALFLCGRDLEGPERCIALVGSRAASSYGVRHATRLARDLVALGFTIVSGLARGVDAAAHRGALGAGGATVAVLPGGLDAVTPRHHAALAEAIALSGTLASEHPEGEPTFRGAFVERNRLIAALCGATVVVEAAARSGALSTAAAAARLGRAVLAVPGDLEREGTRGCHALLRRGARVCESAGDVLEAIEAWRAGRIAPWPAGARRLKKGARAAHPAAPDPGAAPQESAGPEARLLAALAPEPRPLESLARLAGLLPAAALAGLLTLQWAGVAVACPGPRWARRQSGDG